MRTCPYCQSRVKEENFADHLARVHGAQGRAHRRGTAKRITYILAGVLTGIVLVGAVALVLQNRIQPRVPGAAVPTGATTAALGTRVGELAPDFRVVDMNGRAVTRSSLTAGKPGLIFFTATWCLPCIEGLRHLVKFQQDVGGAPFNVLIVFVDPRETDDDLRAYRERFTFPVSWDYALDRDDMIMKYRIRFLDTKFVLDRSGVIRYTDVRPADYSTWQRALRTVGISP